MTEPNATELANGVPTISVGGKEWPIPLLAFRQNKMVIPIIVRLNKNDALTDVTEATMHDLGTLVYIALSRAHPSLTRDEFENLPISYAELLGSIDTIAKQTGVLVSGEAEPAKKPAKKSTSTT